LSDLVFPGFDPASGTLTLPLWAAGAAAALLTALCLVVFRSSTGVFVRLLAVVVLAAGTWIFLERSTAHDRAVERNALEGRALQLTAQATLPGSSLACLDAAIGDALEAACEKSIFATPETVTGAMSYTAARLALLADGLDFALHRDAAYESSLATLRKNLESDRFGILAHVLAQRDNCTSAQCDAFVFLRDVSHLQSNLSERVFDSYVARYAANWPARTGTRPMADAGTALGPGTAAPVSSKYNFPSAASIPPVSIMTAEPVAPSALVPAAPPAAAPAPAQATSPPGGPTAGAPTPPKRQVTRPAQRAANQTPRNAPLPLQVQPAPDSAEQPNTQ
jgi:hypothetical protein